MSTPLLVTRTGRVLDLYSPSAKDISAYDVAWQLSHEVRWNGGLGHLTVAQHSVEVARLLRLRGFSLECQILGLLHDAAEAYVGDVVSPAKTAMLAMAAPNTLHAYHSLEKQVQTAAYQALAGTVPSTAQEDEIRIADADVARFEAWHFGSNHWQQAIERVAPGYVFDCNRKLELYREGLLSTEAAMVLFSETYRNLMNEWTEPE